MTQRPTPPRKCFPRGSDRIKIPYEMGRGSVQQRFCVGCAPQKLFFVIRSKSVGKGWPNKMASQHHDLDDFMRAVTDEIAREYDRIQRRATEDPGTAGDQGEENWATLLRGWLPPIYQVVTKGRILSHEGIASPQIDVLVLHPAYPRHLLDKKLYLAGGVAAAFECKITLKAEHIQTAVKNAVEIRNYVQARTGSPYKELYSPVVYGLLAHSHVWKGEGSTPLDNVERHLLAADLEHIKHPREMLDGIRIADLATWIAH